MCADILETLCMAVLRVCPEELTPHLHTLVTTLVPFARQIRLTHGKMVCTITGFLIGDMY